MDLVPLGILEFTISSVLLIFVSFGSAKFVARDMTESFWIFTAVSALQLGVISSVTSLFHQMIPTGWLIAQVFVSSIALLLQARHRFQIPKPVSAGLLEEIQSLVDVPKHSTLLRLVIWLGLIGLGGIVLLSGITQFLTPILGFDDRMYHASRVLYWVENQSVLHYLTHNDRQVVFSFGSELLFMWPILFTSVELIGRMIFWLGYPVAILGVHLLARELGAHPRVALLTSLAFAGTPMLLRWSVGLSPEFWLTVFVLGTGFWAVRTLKEPTARDFFLTAIFGVLSVNVKFDALAFMPLVLLLPLLGKNYAWIGLRNVFLGGLLAFFLSGLCVTFWFNWMDFGNVMGPEGLRKVHSSDISLTQIYTHAIRLPFLLLEFPVVPTSSLRDELTRLGNGGLALLGADRFLPLETTVGWPGHYTYSVPEYGINYSLGGMLWLPVLGIGLILLVQEIVKTFPKINLSPLAFLVVLDLALLLGIVLLIRWQSDSALPDRFLLSPYALGLVIGSDLFCKFFIKRRWVVVVTLGLLLLMLAPPVGRQSKALLIALSKPVPTSLTDEPFTEAMSQIPNHSRILLVGNQDVRDYPLFAPRDHYSNQVYSWGKAEFDSSRMKLLIQDQHITHVLVQNSKLVGFHWTPAISTVEMVDWLSHQPDITEIPLVNSDMKLYVVAR